MAPPSLADRMKNRVINPKHWTFGETKAGGASSDNDSVVLFEDITVKHESENAMLVAGIHREPVWIPKSLVKMTKNEAGGVNIEVPSWFVKKEGLA